LVGPCAIAVVAEEIAQCGACRLASASNEADHAAQVAVCARRSVSRMRDVLRAWALPPAGVPVCVLGVALANHKRCVPGCLPRASELSVSFCC